jgi:hypothetical protein
MVERDEHVRKLKAHIDQWNAGIKAEYERQLENFRRRSEEAAGELARLQHASADAFIELMRGADRAMQDMREAFERARKNFGSK